MLILTIQYIPIRCISYIRWRYSHILLPTGMPYYVHIAAYVHVLEEVVQSVCKGQYNSDNIV